MLLLVSIHGVLALYVEYGSDGHGYYTLSC